MELNLLNCLYLYGISGIIVAIGMSITMTTARLYDGKNPPLDVVIASKGFWIGILISILSGIFSPIFILVILIIGLSKLILGTIFVVTVMKEFVVMWRKVTPISEIPKPKEKLMEIKPLTPPPVKLQETSQPKVRLDVKLPPPPQSAMEDSPMPDPAQVAVKNGKLVMKSDEASDNKL